MSLMTFREFQDPTAIHKPTTDAGFSDQKNRSFEQVVEPIISDFVKKISTDVLSDKFSQLQPQQINYIIEKIRSSITEIKYNVNDDLSRNINDLWKRMKSTRQNS